jgi:DNA-binding MarR family transcriptional regulator
LLQSRLAEQMHIDKSHMASIVYYLLSEGFIDVEPTILDRRDNLLRLTAKGEDSIKTLQEVIGEVNRKITADISPEQLVSFCTTLRILSTNLEKEYELLSQPLQSRIA